MTRELYTIECRLLDICREYFSIYIRQDNQDKNFFSQYIDFDDISLVYMVLIVEEEYNIEFSQADFKSDSFFNFDGFVSHVYNLIHMK